MTHFERFTDICIICLQNPTRPNGGGFSNEHVIPKSIGGRLTSNFLCKPCNEGFGSGFEAKAKSDPAIRRAINNLKNILPQLHNSIENGQPYLIETPVATISGSFRESEIYGSVKRLPDGSFMVPAELTDQKIEQILKKDGCSEDDLKSALDSWRKTPEGQSIAVLNLVLTRHPATALPDYAASANLSPLVCLKIVYEFSCLWFRSSILSDNPVLNEIRRCLREQTHKSRAFEVEVLEAPGYAAFHGIMFEGNDPYAKFQIRLFGKLAYRVHLANLRFDHPPVRYTHNLTSGKDECVVLS